MHFVGGSGWCYSLSEYHTFIRACLHTTVLPCSYGFGMFYMLNQLQNTSGDVNRIQPSLNSITESCFSPNVSAWAVVNSMHRSFKAQQKHSIYTNQGRCSAQALSKTIIAIRQRKTKALESKWEKLLMKTLGALNLVRPLELIFL